MVLSTLLLVSALLAVLSGVPGVMRRDGDGRIATGLLGLSCLGCLSLAGMALFGGVVWHLDLPWALPWAGLSLRGDALGAVFLIPVGVVPPLISHYGQSYWGDRGGAVVRARLFLGIATGAMVLLTAAFNAVLFLFAWELMTFMGFLLVASEDREPEVRQAGWIYFVAAHSGALCLFAAFALLAGAQGSFLLGPLPTGWAASPAGSAAFLLLLAGFGLKAGLFPLHVWLPGAHGAAPSPISALLSGVMLKMGILGLVRVLALVPDPPVWWAGTLLGLGAVSALLGLALALGQSDVKRILAYSSIENMGIIALGLGLAVAGKALEHPALLVLGGAGALFHVINHALFKPLLFLGAGAVVHGAGTRNLERLGGLGKVMPRTALLFLVGSSAICGLPPLNGFASEWLLYLGAFHGVAGGRWGWAVVPGVVLAMTGALAVAVFTRLYGIAFLGEPRSPEAAQAQEAPEGMRRAMGILAVLCGVLGVFPGLLAPALERAVTEMAPGMLLPALGGLVHFWTLPILVLPGGLAVLACWAKLRRTPFRMEGTWDCGFAQPSSRLQYTAASLAQLVGGFFAWILRPQVQLPRVRGLFPRIRRFQIDQPDPVLDRVLLPGAEWSARLASGLKILQGGHLPIYLLYVVLTLLVFFVWTMA